MIINNCFKIRTLILTAALITSLSFVNHAYALPDFVVTDFTGPTAIMSLSGGEMKIPIEVVVRNQGKTTALFGYIGIEYTNVKGDPLTASHNLRPVRGSWDGRLAPGSEEKFKGVARVPVRVNEVIVLSAIADCLPGVPKPCGVRPPEFRVRPAFRRVPESNETNNKSNPISIYIYKPGPRSRRFSEILDLPPLPEGMSVNWPMAPSIERTVEIRTLSEFESFYDDDTVDKSRTRFRFHTNIDRPVHVNASDVEIVIMPGFKLRNIDLSPSVHRVKISGGGEVGRIRARIDTPIETAEDSGYITDVLINGITLNNSEEDLPNKSEEDPLCQTDHDCDGVTFSGVRRGAVINSTINSLVYPIGVWQPLSSSTITAQNRDIIIANNRLHSTLGIEATVRMHDSVNTVTVHNRLQNGSSDSAGGKHNYRIHGLLRNGDLPLNGGASYAYAAYNLFVNTGAMIGKGGYADPVTFEELPEEVHHSWFNYNQLYQRAESLYEMGRSEKTGIPYVHDAEIIGNRAYSKVDWHLDPPCVFCPRSAPADWVFRDNAVYTYGDNIRPPR